MGETVTDEYGRYELSFDSMGSAIVEVSGGSYRDDTSG